MSAVPASFGKYFLSEKIATGGMAEIYLAKLIGPGGFEKPLIIKKIHPELSGERQFVELFVAEAKTLVALSHGNIVPIYELGMVDGAYFIAMEYIDGPSLEDLLSAMRARKEALRPEVAAYICAELLKGLDYAHRKGEGVIHRDLSPRNVMLSREGEVKLVDFGIAVATSSHRTRASGSGSGPAGSYPHMSPEQAQGQDLDPRSDLFAVGILLWEMLCGRALFARDSDDETLRAVIDDAIDPPSDYCPDAEGELDAICGKALRRDVDARFQSAGAFLIAVQKYLYARDKGVTPAELSTLVASSCPPTTRSTASAPAGDAPEPKRSGTVPIARGKARAPTVRSFATHIGFQEVLDNATPLHGVAAIRDAADSLTPAPPDAETETAAARPRGWLPYAAAAGVAALAASVFLWPRDKQPATSIATVRPALDAGVPTDAALPDAAPALVDASPAIDAAAPDARPRKVDRPPAKGPGTLRLGANPWADVFVDGKKVGRAPGSFTVPAGSHRLELRHLERSKTLQVDIVEGETLNLGLVSWDDTPSD